MDLQVTFPKRMQPTRCYGLGAINWQTGKTVVITRPHVRQREVTEHLESLLAKHPAETICVAQATA